MPERAFDMSSSVRAWIATLAAIAAAALWLGASAPAAQAVPATFWGVVPQAAPDSDQLQRLKRGGVDSIRIPVAWGAVQPERTGPPNWAPYDPLVERAALARIEVLPFLYGPPTWAVPADRSLSSHPPRFLPVRNGVQRSGWKRFVRQAVLRYGPRGSFWAENPGVPRRPIRFWQIGNEQNFKYFVSRPSPAEYGRLVKLSHAAIRSADRGARVILGGLFARPKEALVKRGPRRAYFATDFLRQMYKRTPGVKRSFHGVALHPYTGTFKRLPRYIEDIRKVLKASRDAGKGLWLTELGWSSQRPRRGNAFAKGLGGQARELRGAFRLLRNNQRKWRVKRLYWFAVDDMRGACNFCDGSGLFRNGFKPKPSWHSYVRFSGGRPR